MIKAGRFLDFTENVVQRSNEEEEEKALWEIWLHKVYDKTYNAFKRDLGMKEETAAPTKEKQIEAVQRTCDILGGFHPVMEAGDNGHFSASRTHSNRQ